MKKFFKRLICFILIMSFICMDGAPNTVYAKMSSKQKKIYKQCLGKYFNTPNLSGILENVEPKNCSRFAFADVNGDGKKEFIVCSEGRYASHFCAVYKPNGKNMKISYYSPAYSDGEKKSMSGSCDDWGYSQLSDVISVSKKGFADEMVGHTGVYILTYYKFTSGGASEVAHVYQKLDEKTYFVNGKATSYSEYKRVVDSLGKFHKVTYHKYNSKNVRKYL